MGTKPVLGDRGAKKFFVGFLNLVGSCIFVVFGSAHVRNARDAGALAISCITADRDK